MARKKSFEHTLDVEFGIVSIVGDTVKVGVTVPRCREGLLDIVDVLFGGSQLKVELQCDPNADADVGGQTTFDDDKGLSICGIPVARSYSGSKTHFHTSLSFPDSSEIAAELGRLSKHHGKLLCTRIGDAKTRDSDDDGEGD